jgi:hypothetical protein
LVELRTIVNTEATEWVAVIHAKNGLGSRQATEYLDVLEETFPTVLLNPANGFQNLGLDMDRSTHDQVLEKVLNIRHTETMFQALEKSFGEKISRNPRSMRLVHLIMDPARTKSMTNEELLKLSNV